MDIQWTEESVFNSYDIFEETFKAVSSHSIKAAVLIPKGLEPGRHPVIYNFHGGFLVSAHSLFAPFFPKWVNKLSLEHSAIVVSPDYRLLPSANGAQDILDDIEDSWEWTKSVLPSIMEEKAPGHSLDFSRILLSGGSAGGFCAAQLALSHPDDFQALAMVYPFLDPKDRIFVDGPRSTEPNVLRFDREDMPSMEDTLKWIEGRRQNPHSKADLSGTPFAIAACHYGFYHSRIFDNKSLNKSELIPLERFEAGARLPKTIWVMHGDDDATVPFRCSDSFVKLVRERFSDTAIRYDLFPGADHAFEFNEEVWESFAFEALGFVIKGWLA